MLIENMMYLALGALVASLVALLIMPAVWRRAVRLTKRRIEAVTPITLSEFRADKDQLRAEFALSTRRLEMNVEALRKRLADQLAEINKKKTDMSLLKGERDQHAQVLRELEQREVEARRRVLELEKEAADLAQRLRMRDREYASRLAELQELRNPVEPRLHNPPEVDGQTLTGDYHGDIEQLAAALSAERQRADFLDRQARDLIARLDSKNSAAGEAKEAVAEFRDTLANQNAAAKAAELSAAEARLANAESQLNALLQEASPSQPQEAPLADAKPGPVPAGRSVEQLRDKVVSLERMIMSSWGKSADHQALRDKLGEIATDVGAIVHAGDTAAAGGTEHLTLFDRVQQFAEPDAPSNAGSERGERRFEVLEGGAGSKRGGGRA